jgi:hypothetical protein
LKSERSERASKEKEITDIERSERAEKISGMVSELEELNSKKQELEGFVLNVLGPLKRVFKKYAKAIEEGKASGINVGKYANDPAETYLRGEHTLPDILAKIQKSIQTGVLDLDKNESDKAIKKIRAISFSYLEKARSDYNQIVSKIRSIEVQMNEMDINKEIERLQREIESIDGRIDSKSKSIGRIEEEIGEKKGEIMDINRKLTEKLSDFIGGRCEIV